MIKIENKEKCCGCSACADRCPKQCIIMKEDEQGFLYPSIDLSLCVNCGLCEKVCPVLNQNEPHKPIVAYAAKNTDEKIRMTSSSGGVFYALAEKVINGCGVVFGAKFNDSWEVVHDYAESAEGLKAFQGSKYVQSDIGECYNDAEKFLKQGRKVLFSGTPCEIAGLRKYLGKEYDNLLAVDVICHGVPSRRIWRDYLQYILRPKAENGKNTVLQDCSLKDILYISFRDKTTGWKKFGFAALRKPRRQGGENSVLQPSSLNNEIIHETLDQNLFMKGFLKNLYLRPSCYNCPAKSGKSCSDITLGDLWGVNEILPYMDDDKGTSAVLINSSKGKAFFDSLRIEKVDCDYDAIVRYNPAIVQSVALPAISGRFWRVYESSGIVSAFDFMQKKLRVGFLSRLLHNTRHYISLLVHSFTKKHKQ